MNWPNWFKKESKINEPLFYKNIEDIKGQIMSLPKDPNIVYVLWFEHAMNPKIINVIRETLKNHELNVITITGTRIPDMYKLEKTQ